LNSVTGPSFECGSTSVVAAAALCRHCALWWNAATILGVWRTGCLPIVGDRCIDVRKMVEAKVVGDKTLERLAGHLRNALNIIVAVAMRACNRHAKIER